MPKQSSNITDFSKGMNYNADDTDLFQLRSVALAHNVNFDLLGKITAFDPVDNTLTFDDGESNVSGNISGDYDDLDTVLGTSTALDISSVGNTGSDTEGIQWEAGVYEFYVTNIKDLGNGILEEGPPQHIHSETWADTDTYKGRFTINSASVAWTIDPSWLVTGNTVGRLYYQKESTSHTTAVGLLHLCDILYITGGTYDYRLRSIGDISTPSDVAIIDIEEPPTSASFEMNVGYPSDVGILDVSASGGIFSDVEAKVKLGMVTYVAKSGYIYRSVPGQPDIFPTDNWIDMTAYGASTPCKAMYGIGNLLCYFTSESLILFDVTNDTIVKTLKGNGITDTIHSLKIKEGVVFRPPSTSLENADFLFFDGNQIVNLTKNRHHSDSISTLYYTHFGFPEVGRWPIQYQSGLDWFRWVHDYVYIEGTNPHTHIDFHYYSFKTDTVFKSQQTSDDDGSTWYDRYPYISLGAWHAGDPTRYKKVYKILIYGKDITTMTVEVRKEDRSADELHTMTSSYTTEATRGAVTWTLIPDSSLRVRKLYLKFNGLSSTAGEGELWHIGIVYRMLNKF